MPYLIDSDWLIDALSGVASAHEQLARLAPHGLAVSIISIGEIFEGAMLSADPQGQVAGFQRFISGIPVLNLNEPIMMTFARLRASLRQAGQRLPDFDLLIAATALHHDLILLSRNRRHFQRIPGLTLFGEP